MASWYDYNKVNSLPTYSLNLRYLPRLIKAYIATGTIHSDSVGKNISKSVFEKAMVKQELAKVVRGKFTVDKDKAKHWCVQYQKELDNIEAMEKKKKAKMASYIYREKIPQELLKDEFKIKDGED